MPTAIRIREQTQIRKNEVFMIMEASLLSFRPRSMEKSGAPPEPKRLLKARMIVMIGKQSPTDPRAVVPTSGILAI